MRTALARVDHSACRRIASGGSALAGSLSADVARQAQHNWPEFLDLLAIPNVADQPADIQRNATFLEQAFAQARLQGAAARQSREPPGRARRARGCGAESAHRAVVRAFRRPAGDSRELVAAGSVSSRVKTARRAGQVAGRRTPGAAGESARSRAARVRALGVGRQGADHDAADRDRSARARSSKSPAINVKVLLDPEEEMSSPSLAGMIERDRAAFAADAMVILDGPQHDSGRSTIVFGNRGITQATLTVFGPRAPLHSGHFGNYAPNPAMRLARLLASMKDDNGRVLVKGYYDGVSLSSAERASLTARRRRRSGAAQAHRHRARREGRRHLPGSAAVSVAERARHGRGRRRRESREHRAERGGRRDRHAHDADDRRTQAVRADQAPHRAAGLSPGRAGADRRRARDVRQARELPPRLGAGRVAHADGCGCRAVGVHCAEVADRAEPGGASRCAFA